MSDVPHGLADAEAGAGGGATRTALARACYAALTRTGVPAVWRRVRRSGVILCYHNVVAPPLGAVAGDPAVHLALARFEEQMRWLRERYDVVGLAELLERLATGRSVARLAVLTFDDAYAGFFSHAWPLLMRLGLPATVFVVAGNAGTGAPFWWDRPAAPLEASMRGRLLDDLAGDERRILPALGGNARREPPPPCRPADWGAIAAAAREGLALGAHSTTHRTLTRLGDQEMEREIAGCREVIRARAGVTPEFFAYPYGRWNAKVRDAVQRAGFRAALTLEYGLAHGRSDPWALRRVNVPAGIPMAAFEAWAAGLWARSSSDERA